MSLVSSTHKWFFKHIENWNNVYLWALLLVAKHLTGSDLVEIELTIVDVGWTRKLVIVSPISTGLSFLVEQGTRGAEEPEVPDAPARYPNADMESFAARLRIGVVSAEDSAAAVESLRSPCEWRLDG